MKLDELIEKYEIGKYNQSKFHKELNLYHEVSKKPTMCKATEMKWLNELRFDIIKKYEINYETFQRNLGYLIEYRQLSGGRQ